VFETILWFVLGLTALIGGAELLVRSASRLAGFFGISRLIIGLTVVAFGTSAPELAISIKAGIDGQTDIMLGNIVGSNITNILLILGLTAIIIPLKVHANLIKIDVPVMIGVTFLLYFFAWNGFITFWECLTLSVLLLIYMFFLFRQSGATSTPSDFERKKRTPAAIIIYAIIGLAGLALLILGARWLVESAVVLAELAGVSELVIGLTVVALGTSLPEVVTALVAAIKKERDIAVGSVIGSNILNILAVLGVSGLFIPDAIPVQSALLRFDLLILIAVSVACIPIFFTGHKISRWEGVVFVSLYLCYIFYLFLSSGEHAVIETFSTAMMLFVIPITVITILVIASREWVVRQRFKNFDFGKAINEEAEDE
jgi:cation:H+ antiporter